MSGKHEFPGDSAMKYGKTRLMTDRGNQRRWFGSSERSPLHHHSTSAWLERTARAAACVGAVLASGCGTATFIVQQYEGEPRPSTEISVLRVNGSSPVRLEELDGEVLAYELHDRGARVHIEMQPGSHEIGLADGAGLPLKRRRFVAEPGKVYRPMVFHTDAQASEDLPLGAWVVAIYEVDPTSDDIVREISQVQR